MGQYISSFKLIPGRHGVFEPRINGAPMVTREGKALGHGHDINAPGIAGQHTFPDLLEVMEVLYDRIGIVPSSRPVNALRPTELRDFRAEGVTPPGLHTGGGQGDHDYGDQGHSH